LERAAATVEGVGGTRAWVFRRRIWVTIRVRPRPRPAAEIEAEVSGVLKSAMDRIGLVDRPRVLLRLREKH
jgi:hypothetical protein